MEDIERRNESSIPDLQRHANSASLEAILIVEGEEMAPARPVVATSNVQPNPLVIVEKVRLRLEDFSKIVDYLENPDHFAALYGAGRRTRIGGRVQSKKTIYRQMLIALHPAGFPKEITTGENLGKRVDRYVKRYKEALLVKNDSGGGLTTEEIALGMSLEDKLNKICPHFERMHVLYGERANISPPAIGAFGIGPDDIYSQPKQVDEYCEAAADNLEAPAPLEVFEDSVAAEEIEGPASPTEILLENRGPSIWDEYPTLTNIANENYEGDVIEGGGQGEAQSIGEIPSATQSSTPLEETVTPPAQAPPISTPSTTGHQIPSPTPGQCRPPLIPQPNTLPSVPLPIPLQGVGRGRTREVPVPTPTRSRSAAASSASSKPLNFASIYSDGLLQRAECMKDVAEAKRKWKEAKLHERRVARVDTMADQAQREKDGRLDIAQREMDARLDLNIRERQAQEDTLQRERDAHMYKIDVLKQERKTQLLLELFRSGHSEEHTKSMIKLIDSIDIPSGAPSTRRWHGDNFDNPQFGSYHGDDDLD